MTLTVKYSLVDLFKLRIALPTCNSNKINFYLFYPSKIHYRNFLKLLRFWKVIFRKAVDSNKRKAVFEAPELRKLATQFCKFTLMLIPKSVHYEATIIYVRKDII